jgi:hypothetical protein
MDKTTRFHMENDENSPVLIDTYDSNDLRLILNKK